MNEGMITAFTSAFQSVASDANSMLLVIIPVALSIAGVVWVARKAFRWFKSIGG